MSKLIIVGGGARSGKSTFALELARTRGQRRAFVATAQAFDDEMAERIRNHRAERGDSYRTIEEPVNLTDAVARVKDCDVVVVDCLTLWLSNLLLQQESPDTIMARVDALAALDRNCALILVTNEVGMGIVPEHRLAREFRDLAGRVHQRFSSCADELYFAVLGTVLRLRPGPLVTMTPGEIA